MIDLGGEFPEKEGGTEILGRISTSLIWFSALAGSVRADVASTYLVDALLPRVQSVRSWIPGLPISPTWQAQASEPAIPDGQKPSSGDDRLVRFLLMNQAVLREEPGVPVFQEEYARSFPEATSVAGPDAYLMNSLVLTGQGSCVLCIYALVGLGLYGSPNLIRKISPHSVADMHPVWGLSCTMQQRGVTPELSYNTPPGGLPPVHDAWSHLGSHYRLRIVVSSRRESQFTLDVIASRGPPVLS